MARNGVFRQNKRYNLRYSTKKPGFFSPLPTDNCQLPTVNCQLSTAN
ncbi:MAG: hypothetical protein JGK01_20065 [Microcoleus sp. PH2017_03_ELD_O_A]|nr:hypothetical protein [Microcoleus sp. PH2017_03_ELD_O_A]